MAIHRPSTAKTRGGRKARAIIKPHLHHNGSPLPQGGDGGPKGGGAGGVRVNVQVCDQRQMRNIMNFETSNNFLVSVCEGVGWGGRGVRAPRAPVGWLPTRARHGGRRVGGVLVGVHVEAERRGCR